MSATMRLWAALYAIIWVVFLEFLLSMIPLWQPFLTDAHMGLGVLIVLITYYNFQALRATTAPGRLKRIASVTYQLSIVMVVLGVLVFFNIGSTVEILFGVTLWGVILFVHIANAFAIITQSAATALGYDMWEEKDFLKETSSGEVPPAPSPRGSPVPKP